MHSQLFEAASGVSDPWFVSGVDFDAATKRLTIQIDFTAGSRFPHPEVAGAHPVHDTVVKRYGHLSPPAWRSSSLPCHIQQPNIED